MKELNLKLKRQIELVGYLLNPDKIIDKADYEYMYNCTRATTDRDIRELKERGIFISSRGKKGLVLDKPIEDTQLFELCETYLQLSLNPQNFSQATKLFCQKHSVNSIDLLSSIQKCIDEDRELIICYVKNDNAIPKQYSLKPLRIFNSQKTWRVLSRVDGILKQFLLEKITNYEIGKKLSASFKEENIDAIFSRSFGSWLSDESFEIKLLVLEPLASKYKEKKIMPDQKIINIDEHSITIQFSVNSINEVASWVVGQGKYVRVVSPNNLITLVKKIASESIEQY